MLPPYYPHPEFRGCLALECAIKIIKRPEEKFQRMLSKVIQSLKSKV
mgnify:CR=1 FL=1